MSGDGESVVTWAASSVQGGHGDRLDRGVGLCLSGGGYRAMVFHVGVLWRLNELGYLPKLTRVSSVSGGSLTAAVLGLAWNDLQSRFNVGGVADNFDELLVKPVRRMASTNVDVKSVLSGILGFGSVGDKVVKHYRATLFGNKTLQDLPNSPRFVINATNVQTGALFRFSKPYMADYKIGQVLNPDTAIAIAVAASSAFPPVLSPIRLKLKAGAFEPGTEQLQKKPYTTDLVLTDGGVYDNMGLETVWKNVETVLVSDGGAPFTPEPEPKSDWPRHAMRVLDLVDNQVRSLRRREVCGAFERKERLGAYWGIGTDFTKYPVRSLFKCDAAAIAKLAATPTRLEKMDTRLQERLINWGYAVSDAAMVSYVDQSLPAATRLPYPESGV